MKIKKNRKIVKKMRTIKPPSVKSDKISIKDIEKFLSFSSRKPRT